jgi:hypothetical protein
MSLHGSGCGLVVAPVFKTGVTRLSRVGWVRFPHSPATCCALTCGALLALSLGAAAPATAQGPADTLLRPPTITVPTGRPISPRRAFVRSLLIPGYGQIALDRTMAAGVFAFVEVSALGMMRRSALNLRDARAQPDSVVLTYERDPATGQLVLDAQGRPIPATFRVRGIDQLIRARRTHYEDWVAVLLFNHLFAAADAYVAAHLWDFPATVAATVTPAREARIAATFTW